MKLLDLYERILNYVGVVVEKNGATSISIAGRSEPTMLNGKRLMMPTRDVLQSTDKDIVIFHPFQEYVNRGESDVVRKMRRILNVRLNLAVTAVMDGLLRLLESPADHKKLDHQQRELLIAVTAGKLKNVNGESVLRAKLATMIAKEFPTVPDSLCCNIFMKKSGTFQGVKHQRVGIVSFGFYEALERHASSFNKEQYATLEQLFEFIFPDSKEPSAEAWNGFSDSAECPWLDCLLKTSYNLVSRLRELTNLYSEFMTSPETGDIPSELIFDVSWLDEIDNLKAYKQEILLIPSQAGNEGTVETAAPANQTLAAAATAAANAPIRAAVPNTQPAQQTVQQPVQQFQQPMMQPQMMQQPMQQQPQVKTTADGRIDLSGPSPFPSAQMPMMGSGVTGPIQQQMMMQNMQQQMMMNPSLMAAYANNGLLPMQPMFPQQQMMQPMQQMMMPGGMGMGGVASNSMMQMQPMQVMGQPMMNRGFPQATYGVPGISQAPAPAPMSNISPVHNV